MVALHVEFQLDGITPEELATYADRVAPAVAAFPGLVEKVFFGNTETNTYGGAYVWTDRASLDAYVASDLFAASKQNPALVNFSARTFEVLEGPTKVASRLAGPLAADTVTPA
jgi:hypothetical protein